MARFSRRSPPPRFHEPATSGPQRITPNDEAPMSRLICKFLFFAGGLLIGALAHAQPTAAPSAPHLTVPSAAELEAARANADDQVESLRRMLAPLGSTGENWSDYLGLPELTEQLAEQPRADVIDGLELSLRPFYQGDPGLERPALLAARAAVAEYLQRLRAVYDATPEAFAGRVADVAAGRAGRGLEREDRFRVADGLLWLAERGQAAVLTQDDRARLSQPNLLVRARADLLTAFLDQPAPEPVSDVSQASGATVRSQGQANVTVRVSPQPSETQAVLILQSHMWMPLNSRASKGPATVFTHAETNLEGFTRVEVSPDRYVVHPTQSSGGTCLTVNGACSKFNGFLDRLVKRVAVKQANKERASGARRITGDAQEQLHEEIDQEVAEELAEDWEEFQKELRRPLIGRAMWPQNARLSTDASALWATIELARSTQLAAPASPPSLPDDGPLSARVHESLLINYAEGYIGGDTLRVSELEAQLENFGRDAESDDKVDAKPDDDSDISIVMRRRRPIVLRVENGGVEVSIHGDEFIYNERIYPPMDITLTYDLALEPDRLVARQVGEASFAPPGFEERTSQRLSGSEVAIRRLLRNRMKRDLPREIKISDRSIMLDGVDPAYGPLQLTSVRGVDGWFEVDTMRTR